MDNSVQRWAYFGVRVDGGGMAEVLLDTRSNNRRAKAVFFFTVEQLFEQDALIRQIINEGHKIGLIPKGNTLAAVMRDLVEGKTAVKHILRQNITFVLGDDLSDEIRNGLCKEGYIARGVNNYSRSDGFMGRGVL